MTGEGYGERVDRSPRKRGVQQYRQRPVSDFPFETTGLYRLISANNRDGFVIERDDRLTDFLGEGVRDYVFRMRVTKLFSGPSLNLYAIGFREPVDEQLFRIAFA